MGEIFLITGETQTGKTNLCLDLYKEALEANIKVGGVISPAVFEGGDKTAIDVLNLKNGKQKRLADVKTGGQSELETQHWSFSLEAVDWGNDMLREAVPCDLLIVDELGPLEFYRAEGWVNGFGAVENGEYRAAVVVIRPSLIDIAARRWNVSRIIDLNLPAPVPLTGKVLFNILDLC